MPIAKSIYRVQTPEWVIDGRGPPSKWVHGKEGNGKRKRFRVFRFRRPFRFPFPFSVSLFLLNAISRNEVKYIS